MNTATCVQSLREFKESDISDVVSLIYRTIDKNYTGFYSPTAIEFFKAFHAEENVLRRSKQGRICVLEVDGAIVATGASTDNRIYGVFVAPGHQGLGYGRKVMAYLEDKLVEDGHEQVELGISLPSRRFYESIGYNIVEEVHKEAKPGHQLMFWKGRKSLRSARQKVGE